MAEQLRSKIRCINLSSRAQRSDANRNAKPSDLQFLQRDLPGRLLSSRFSFGEPAPAQFLFGDAREIGLDIENRRAVEHVNAAHMQIGAVAPKQFNCGKSDRIRSP